MTGKQRALIFGIAGLSALLGIVGFGWVMYRTAKNVTSPAPPTDADRRLVVTAEQFAPLGFEDPSPDAELFHAMRNFDGTRNIEYDYSTSRDPEAEEYLSVSSSVFVFPQPLTAMQTYKMQQIAIKAGMKFAKLRIIDAPQLLTAGDQRYAAIIERDGEPYGNLFLFRQGRVVHACTIMGVGIDDPETSHQLLGPVIEETKRQFEK